MEHVIIVLKENHPFDNHFGTFPGAEGMTMPRLPTPPHFETPSFVLASSLPLSLEKAGLP